MFETGPGKGSGETMSRTKVQTKGLKVWLNWENACLPCLRPGFNLHIEKKKVPGLSAQVLFLLLSK